MKVVFKLKELCEKERIPYSAHHLCRLSRQRNGEGSGPVFVQGTIHGHMTAYDAYCRQYRLAEKAGAPPPQPFNIEIRLVCDYMEFFGCTSISQIIEVWPDEYIPLPDEFGSRDYDS